MSKNKNKANVEALDYEGLDPATVAMIESLPEENRAAVLALARDRASSKAEPKQEKPVDPDESYRQSETYRTLRSMGYTHEDAIVGAVLQERRAAGDNLATISSITSERQARSVVDQYCRQYGIGDREVAVVMADDESGTTARTKAVFLCGIGYGRIKNKGAWTIDTTERVFHSGYVSRGKSGEVYIRAAASYPPAVQAVLREYLTGHDSAGHRTE